MNKNLKAAISYFTKLELAIWLSSIFLIVVSFSVFDRANFLTLAASLIGVTALIFNAKGNPTGQVLTVVFSVLYGIISYTFAYFGEMITYLGMTAPMAIIALISWLKNPYNGNRAEVRINHISLKEWLIMSALTAAITAAFYFILQAFNTANIIPSTISVTTSFVAVYLTFRRSPYFAVAYAANDIVLIVLWVMASLEDMSYLSVVICFAMFLISDIYGFINWLKMQRRQATVPQIEVQEDRQPPSRPSE